MSGGIELGHAPLSFAEQLKSQVNIVDFVGEYVRLKRQGVGPRYVGLCPFHREKTPSFGVRYDWQLYKCFGCDAHGDVISFARQMENLSFPDTLTFLSIKYGIDTRCENPRLPQQRRLTSEDLSNAELFRVGFGWALERHLALLKELWILDESALDDPDQIRQLTTMLRRIRTWPARTLLGFMRRYRRVRPWFMADCIREAKEAHLQVATALAETVGGKSSAA